MTSQERRKRPTQAAEPAPYALAVNGRAFRIDEHDNGPTFVRIKTSLPVFKVFGLAPDGTKLLYSPLKDGRPSGVLYLEDLTTSNRTRVTTRLVLTASMSPVDGRLIAYTFAGNGGFGLGLADLSRGVDKTLVANDVFTETISWDNDGSGVNYFNTTQAVAATELNSPDTVDGRFHVFEIGKTARKPTSLDR